MSNSLKQDLIKSIGIDNYIRGCKQSFEETNTLHLYNVQISYRNEYSFKHEFINEFIYAIDEEDAKKLVLSYYSTSINNVINIHCYEVNIKRGMMFSV